MTDKTVLYHPAMGGTVSPNVVRLLGTPMFLETMTNEIAFCTVPVLETTAHALALVGWRPVLVSL